jgi:hypothetical protein
MAPGQNQQTAPATACPATGFDVQTLWAPHDREEKQGSHYESVTCSSCSLLHFVNRKTGKLLGHEKDSG